jgi:hypothetical protein
MTFLRNLSRRIGRVLPEIIKKVMKFGVNNTYLKNLGIFHDGIEYIGYFMFNSLQLNDETHRFYNVFHPFLIIKSAIILAAIRTNTTIREALNFPPKTICFCWMSIIDLRQLCSVLALRPQTLPISRLINLRFSAGSTQKSED